MTTTKKAILELLKDSKKSQVWLAEKMGYSRASGVSQMLSRGNITTETLIRICDLLDYEITLQPKRRSGSRPQGQIVIDTSKEGDDK